jgi:demethylmenaquinone methyltransferase / 2-methoxy-6-polyprenyl-1,4-benzoquinol methylase
VSEHTARSVSNEPARVVTRANLRTYLGDAARKQQLVTPLFDLIAPRYDRFTRVFSYGLDARWKDELIRRITRDVDGKRVDALDVACGTGDLAIRTALAIPTAHVRGIDVSEQMLAIARSRLQHTLHGRVTFERGDLARLDAPTASVDVVTAGYAIRNVPDPRGALGELARVLRPGGRLYVLEFFRPADVVWRALYLGYLRVAGATVGWLWHRAPAAYEYIAASISQFATCEEFAAWLKEAGFHVTAVRPKLRGGVALVLAVRR